MEVSKGEVEETLFPSCYPTTYIYIYMYTCKQKWKTPHVADSPHPGRMKYSERPAPDLRAVGLQVRHAEVHEADGVLGCVGFGFEPLVFWVGQLLVTLLPLAGDTETGNQRQLATPFSSLCVPMAPAGIGLCSQRAQIGEVPSLNKCKGCWVFHFLDELHSIDFNVPTVCLRWALASMGSHPEHGEPRNIARSLAGKRGQN